MKPPSNNTEFKQNNQIIYSMKKSIFLAALLTASLLAACTGSETNLEESDGALSVTASIGESTTAGVSTRALVTSFSSATIGVFVAGDGYPTTGTSSVCTVSTTGTNDFTPGTPSIYINSSATVYAFYPTTGSGEITTLTNAATKAVSVLAADNFAYTGTDGSTQTDYLWATPNGVDKTDRVANLTFNHALTKIVFIVKKSADYAGTGTLTSIVLKESLGSLSFLSGTSGTMKIADGTISGLAAPTGDSLTFINATGVTINASAGSAETAWFLVAPLSSSTYPTTISLTMKIDGEYYTGTLPTTGITSWNQGKSYTYTVTANSGSLTVDAPVTITDWTSGGTASGTVN
jgi:hypothetical protein